MIDDKKVNPNELTIKIGELENQLHSTQSLLDIEQQKLSETSAELDTSQREVTRLTELLGPQGEKLGSWRITLVNNIGFVLTCVSVLVVIVAGIFFFKGEKPPAYELFSQLSNPEAARGLITFVLVMVTVVMSLLLLISSFRTGPGSAESFTRGKEVFTILVGILGTIVGFYFGLSPDQPPAPPADNETSTVESIGTNNPPSNNPVPNQ